MSKQAEAGLILKPELEFVQVAHVGPLELGTPEPERASHLGDEDSDSLRS